MKIKIPLTHVLLWTLVAITACTLSYICCPTWFLSVGLIGLATGYMAGTSGKYKIITIGGMICLLAAVCAWFSPDANPGGLFLGAFLWVIFVGTGLQMGEGPHRDPWSIFIG